VIVFAVRDWQPCSAPLACFGDPAGERLAGELPAGAGRKQRRVRRTAAFGEPHTEDASGLLRQRGDPLLPALAGGGDVRAGAEVDVAAAQACQL
jgi:NaMN:DMB phosphoribosyltransferase